VGVAWSRCVADTEAFEGILEDCAAGAIAPAIAVSRLLLAGADREMALQAHQRAVRRCSLTSHEEDACARLEQVRQLLGRLTPDSIAVASLIRGGRDGTRDAPSIEAGIAMSRDFFDRAVAFSGEASVALYSLGDPELLAAATVEIVDLFEEWGLLGPERSILQIGSGIGRLEEALAARVRVACGIDVSANMLAVARRRCAGLANVLLLRSSGRDLSLFKDETFDLVYGVDSFPYMHGAGMSLVEAHVREAHRVLRSRGELVILNFSYRGRPEQDRQDMARLGNACGFDVLVAGSQPFRSWDALAFRLRARD
jgi:SAM-dependent methyltransferase